MRFRLPGGSRVSQIHRVSKRREFGSNRQRMGVVKNFREARGIGPVAAVFSERRMLQNMYALTVIPEELYENGDVSDDDCHCGCFAYFQRRRLQEAARMQRSADQRLQVAMPSKQPSTLPNAVQSSSRLVGFTLSVSVKPGSSDESSSDHQCDAERPSPLEQDPPGEGTQVRITSSDCSSPHRRHHAPAVELHESQWRSFGLFDKLSEAQLNKTVSRMVVKNYHVGDKILSKGTIGTTVICICVCICRPFASLLACPQILRLYKLGVSSD